MPSGWFVVNTRDARWFENDVFGAYTTFEPEGEHFEQIGVGIGVLQPGQPNGMYHGEDAQEDFLVLAGECLLLIEGDERLLRAWDFVHCPPWAEHIFVGAGDGPCVVLAVGARRPGRGIRYPVDDLALKHRAGVEQATTDWREAYKDSPEDRSIDCPL
jgi:uncharacterized cupin superfamily protein